MSSEFFLFQSDLHARFCGTFAITRNFRNRVSLDFCWFFSWFAIFFFLWFLVNSHFAFPWFDLRIANRYKFIRFFFFAAECACRFSIFLEASAAESSQMANFVHLPEGRGESVRGVIRNALPYLPLVVAELFLVSFISNYVKIRRMNIPESRPSWHQRCPCLRTPHFSACT